MKIKRHLNRKKKKYVKIENRDEQMMMMISYSIDI